MTRTLIPNGWAVPNKFRSRMGEAAGRQRHMADEGHLLLVLHAVPEAGVTEPDARLFWRDKAGVWKSSHGGGVHRPGHGVVAAGGGAAPAPAGFEAHGV